MTGVQTCALPICVENMTYMTSTASNAGVVDTMLDDVLAQQKVGQELWERLKQAAEERGLQWEAEAAGQEATSRGFQAMSQDTGDELNGRFTDIQGKVTDIRGYVMAMAQTGGIITAINNIATLGDRIDQMSVACYESLRFDAETLIEVREIDSSTKNMDKTLARIEEGINSIKKKDRKSTRLNSSHPSSSRMPSSA